MQNDIVTRKQWLKARSTLLVKEKAQTRAREALAKERQQLPWVTVETDYEFMGPNGPVSLSELFDGHSQLAIYHLMFGAGWEKPCPGCTSWAYAINGSTYQFKDSDAAFAAVSRAPYAGIETQREKLGWDFNWVSSADCTFGLDFYASSDDLSDTSHLEIGGPGGERTDFDRGENHGASVFYKSDAGDMFHTYSCYNRGIEELNGAFGYFDLLPKGRGF